MPRPFLMAVVLGCVVGCVQNAVPQRPTSPGQEATAPAQKVDINHASVNELMRVPGLTRVWAERIVRYRPYRAKNQLLLDGIVTSDVYQLIKDHVVAHRRSQ